MGFDDIEPMRRDLLKKSNAEPGSRESLEHQYGQVWDRAELRRDYDVLGFMAPIVAVERKEDGIKGSLLFQHRPRFYFSFKPGPE